MLLQHIATSILAENDDSEENISDAAVTEKTLNDEFEVTDAGLNYIKAQLEKIDKKAKRIGVDPLVLKIVSQRNEKVKDEKLKIERIRTVYTVKIEGKPPIIDGYEFIASIEHSSAGNIINISPVSSVKSLPADFRTQTPVCDFCHTKRDRLNTFVLKKKETGSYITVGSSCLKNFLPGKDPRAILEYAKWLSFILRGLVGAEDMEDDEGGYGGGGGGTSSKYYDSDTYLYYVCLAYMIDGRFTSGKAARAAADAGDYGVTTTASFARTLMNLGWEPDTKYKKELQDKINRYETQAKALFEEVQKWKETKDWDAEIEKNPEMADYFHNMKVLTNSPTIQYKNQGYHASLLASYLREKAWKEKQDVQKKQNATKSYVGTIGQKITFNGTLKTYREFSREKMHYNDTGIGYLLIFNDDAGNDILYFPSNPSVGPDDEGKKFTVVGTVKKQQPSKFGVPQTIITRAKMMPVSG